jgi:hypothetical protein
MIENLPSILEALGSIHSILLNGNPKYLLRGGSIDSPQNSPSSSSAMLKAEAEKIRIYSPFLI